VTTIAASALPLAPVDIEIDWSKSTTDSLVVVWKAPLTLPSSLITGYLLEMDDGHGG